MAIRFGITLALMAVIALAGIYYLTSVGGQLDRIAGVNNLKPKNANDIRSALSDIAYLVGEMATTQDRGVRGEASKAIDEARARYKAAMERLEPINRVIGNANLVSVR
jgi:hypothetical protein